MRSLIDRERLVVFMSAIGRSARTEVRSYLVGGASAVLLDWRGSTIDIDLEIRPEADDVLRAIPELKELLQGCVSSSSRSSASSSGRTRRHHESLAPPPPPLPPPLE